MATKHNFSGSQLSEANTDEKDVQIQHQILTESLTFFNRAMPSVALGHVVAGSVIVVALHDVVPALNLYAWLGALICVSFVRLGATMLAARRLMDAPVKKVQNWSNILTACNLAQTCIWGASVLLIWPGDIAHRAVLVTALAGIIAAGGTMLVLHRHSFAIYCLPIAIPAVIQLALSGTRLEIILAVLLVSYSGLLIISVNRLSNVFLDGLRIRFLMQAESRTDALTALANRRGFDESLRSIWQQSIRAQQPMGLLIIDVDRFKTYNDYYGHPQGDIALKKVGELLLEVASRSTDMCARIGGEEFAVIMPATNLEGSRQVAEDFQEALTNARIPHRKCDRGFLSVSIGLNVITPEKSSTADLFMLETDKALYEAKESGRNKICVARSKTSDE
ncbi:MAG: GGDEF domain-containing protein [Gammaproteobacteria bacterium]|nr:GGDEF domain-containing protein [Gammaproteobacteria bacterium]